MRSDSPLILAVDATDIDRCKSLILQTQESIGLYKFGLEFYLKNGAFGVEAIRESFPGIRIFLDLKLHDIPNTVAAAARSVAHLEPEILTVHASGGGAMITAAANELPKTKIAAVTVLTSLAQSDLEPFGNKAISEIVLSLAACSISAGARALVASPLELKALRSVAGGAKLITPGIRINGSSSSGASSDDQIRTATPMDALAAGADYLVIGRPITKAADPGKAAQEILNSIS
jgi:orotidine-5'-phosphate decarboxylase